jgi:hypothetical protein
MRSLLVRIRLETGDSYVFYKSTNGGVTWTESIMAPQSQVTGIHFISGTGFLCELNGDFKKQPLAEYMDFIRLLY